MGRYATKNWANATVIGRECKLPSQWPRRSGGGENEVASLEVLPDPGGACASRPLKWTNDGPSKGADPRAPPRDVPAVATAAANAVSGGAQGDRRRQRSLKIRDLFPGGLLASRSYIRSTTAVGRRAPDPAEAEA